MTLDEVNALDDAAFVAALGGVFEHSPWVAQRALAARPFATVDALQQAMVGAMRQASDDQKLALLRAHPELAGRAMARRQLTAGSTAEQAGAGLDCCSPEEFARLQDLNSRYNERFGFPFILAVKDWDRPGIIGEFARRLAHDRASEFAECLSQVERIASLRLAAMIRG